MLRAGSGLRSPHFLDFAGVIFVRYMGLSTGDGLGRERYLASANFADRVQLAATFTANGLNELFFDLGAKKYHSIWTLPTAASPRQLPS